MDPSTLYGRIRGAEADAAARYIAALEAELRNIKEAARLVVEEWHSFGYDSDDLIEHMDALSALINE